MAPPPPSIKAGGICQPPGGTVICTQTGQSLTRTSSERYYIKQEVCWKPDTHLAAFRGNLLKFDTLIERKLKSLHQGMWSVIKSWLQQAIMPKQKSEGKRIHKVWLFFMAIVSCRDRSWAVQQALLKGPGSVLEFQGQRAKVGRQLLSIRKGNAGLHGPIIRQNTVVSGHTALNLDTTFCR